MNYTLVSHCWSGGKLDHTLSCYQLFFHIHQYLSTENKYLLYQCIFVPHLPKNKNKLQNNKKKYQKMLEKT